VTRICLIEDVVSIKTFYLGLKSIEGCLPLKKFRGMNALKRKFDSITVLGVKTQMRSVGTELIYMSKTQDSKFSSYSTLSEVPNRAAENVSSIILHRWMPPNQQPAFLVQGIKHGEIRRNRVTRSTVGQKTHHSEAQGFLEAFNRCNLRGPCLLTAVLRLKMPDFRLILCPRLSESAEAQLESKPG
jgi:hypothetical protein